MYDYLIVGAGLFGAVFARIMTDAGRKCLVVDRRPHIGGNVYTEKREGINVHCYGAHIFHTDDREVWDFVNRFARFNGFVNCPKASFGGRLYSLPFNMNTFHELWGVTEPEEAKKIIEEQRSRENITDPKNLEEQALSLVGRDVYEKLIRGYTEKQWGRSARELPAFIIKRVPLRFEYNNNYFDDRYQGIPEGGYTALVEKLLEGSTLRLGTDFTAHREELTRQAAAVVYTGMIDEYFGNSLGELEYRSLRFEMETVAIKDFQDCAVVNYTDAAVPFTRIIEHKHFEGTKTQKTIITREYPAKWERGREPFYPVGDEKNRALYEKYRALAENEKNVIFGGRLGTYRYLDMDDVVREAMDLAGSEIEKGRNL